MNSVFEAAYAAWSAGAPLRARRRRYKRFTYGDQWSDMVEDGEGRLVREDRYVRQSGKQPLTNNLIRQLVKNIVGRYRTRCSEAAVYSGRDIVAAARLNALAELDSRMLEEFLISGCAVQRVWRGERFGRQGVWVDNVGPEDFFVNAFRDPRGWDIELVGMLHDMSFPEMVNRFADDDAAREAELARLFEACSCRAGIAAASGMESAFGLSGRPGHCRVAEVWTLDARRESDESPKRIFSWHCRWFAPDGTLLGEHEAASHPFVVKFYPLTDGEVHSFVEDVVDQQKAINRLMVQIDHIMATSAKGVLLFPVDQKPADMSWHDITERWAQPDGIIPITGMGTQQPHQVVTNNDNNGAYQLLQLQMKLFEEVSGVSEALLGKGLSTARGSELYESQVRNATVALADLFDSFASFVQARNEKLTYS